MNTKKTISLLLGAVMLLSIAFAGVACNNEATPTATDKATEAPTQKPTEAPTEPPAETPTEAPTEAPTEKPTEPPTEEPVVLEKKVYELASVSENIRLLGRTKVVKEGIICDHGASGIEFCAYLTGDLILNMESLGNSYFSVFVDGVELETRIFYDVRTGTKTIASFEDEGLHTVRIIKQTESQWSLATLESIEMTGYLTDPPEQRPLYIEFLGDSLTSGYGNLGDSSSEDPGTPLWEDGSKAYSYIACEALYADCNILACSGVGIDKGWTYYDYMDFYQAFSFHRDTADFYEFGRVPDIAIIHLGANDYTCGSAANVFVQKGIELVNYVRDGYGKDIPIIWIYDPKEGMPRQIEEIAATFGGEDGGFYVLALAQNSAGANGHPSVDSHEEAAETLVNFIKEKGLVIS